MKTIKILGVLLSILFSSSVAFSHGETETKNSCTWGWKYKAKARVNFGIGITSNNNKGCDASTPYGIYVSNSCAWQSSENLGGSSQFAGAVTSNWAVCGRGFPNSDLYYQLNLPHEKEMKPIYEASSIEHEPILFSKNIVTIPNITGEMFVSDSHIFSSLEIIIWQPNHDVINNMEDTVANKSEYLWQGKIELLNGEVHLSGNFPRDSYHFVQVENGYKLIFDNETISAVLPHDIDGTHDDIVVSVISDGGAKESSFISSLENETSSNIDIQFSAYPNPTVDIVNISFHLESKEIGTIKIYDATGKLISILYSGSFENIINTSYNFNASNIKQGVYFILIKIENEQFIKKILFEN